MSNILHRAVARKKVSQASKVFLDVSSVANVFATNPQMFSVMSLVNGGTTATFKFYNQDDGEFYPSLETALTLPYAYSGATADLVFISDIHIGSITAAQFETFLNTIDSVVTGATDVFVLGDLVNDLAASYADYLTGRATSSVSTSNWHELAGNHDVIDGAGGFKDEILGDVGALPYYSVTIGNCVFCLVSTEYSFACSAAADTWLQDTITANTDKNCFILTHQARQGTTRSSLIATAGINASTGWMDGLSPIVDSMEWVAWICGHSHGYQSFTEPDTDRIYIGDPPAFKMLPNGDMESDLAFSSYFSTLSYDTSIYHGGARSLKVVDAGAAAAAQKAIATRSGQTYSINGWVRSASTNTGTFLGRIAVASLATGFNVTNFLTGNVNAGDGVPNDNDWHYLSVPFTGTGDIAYVVLGNQSATGDQTWFDDVEVVETT